MNNFKDVEVIEDCNSCEHDIFSLLEKDPNKNESLNKFLKSHKNYNIIKTFENDVLNIKYIPSEIQKILLKTL